MVSSKIEEIFQKILNRFLIFLKKFNSRKKNVFLNFGFAHAEYYLGLNNFFGPFGYFKNCKNNLSENEVKNESLRKLLKIKCYSKFSGEVRNYLNDKSLL